MRSSSKQIYREFVILMAVISLVAFGLSLISRLLFGKESEHITEEISVKIEDIPLETIEEVHSGERVLDRRRRTILGTIEEVSTVPHLYEKAIANESVLVEKKGYCDAILRISIDRENRRNQVDGVFYIGATITLSTRSFAGDGRIVSFHRMGEKR